MAKGSKSKEIITKKILETFSNSFQYDKEIRIPMLEDGELVQIKCVLTCAKSNVTEGGETILPGEQDNVINFEDKKNDNTPTNLTQEEKNNISRLAKILNL